MSYSGCPCFWADPTDLGERSLRRYVSSENASCPGPFGYHNASVTLPDAYTLEKTDGGYRGSWDVPDGEDRWPTRCECGYEFQPDDVWQGDVTRLYRRADTQELVSLRGPRGEGGKGPPGLLTHSDWGHAGGPWEDRYADGINLLAVCPNGGLWHVDGPAWNDGKMTAKDAWTRVGDPRNPPTLTVTPSIVAGDYHGFLQGGAFTAG